MTDQYALAAEWADGIDGAKSAVVELEKFYEDVIAALQRHGFDEDFVCEYSGEADARANAIKLAIEKNEFLDTDDILKIHTWLLKVASSKPVDIYEADIHKGLSQLRRSVFTET